MARHELRKYNGQSRGNALFKVDVKKLWAAFAWLKRQKPYYFNVGWREDTASAWEADDVQVGVTREATEFDGQALPVSSACFQRCMEHAQSEAAAGDGGFPIGRRTLELSEGEAEETESQFWNQAWRAAAEFFFWAGAGRGGEVTMMM